MLHLFKLPIWVEEDTSATPHFCANLATGLLSNLLKQTKDISEEELDQAFEITRREFEYLQTIQEQRGAVDGYEMMTDVLRRIEQAVHSGHR